MLLKSLPLLTIDNAERVVTLKFPIVAGLLVRGEVRTKLRLLSFANGVELRLEEDKGWLESLFMVRLEGRYRAIHHVYSGIVSMVRSMK
jgi:hypothetical protein